MATINKWKIMEENWWNKFCDGLDKQRDVESIITNSWSEVAETSHLFSRTAYLQNSSRRRQILQSCLGTSQR
jgi:hypothetical protein